MLDGTAGQADDGAMAATYSPTVTDGHGHVTVALADDHPGVADPAYRTRRDALAALAASWRPGDPLPRPAFTPVEEQVWRTVAGELAVLHPRHATPRVLAAVERLALPVDHIPQLADVAPRLESLTGFTLRPVAGLAPLRTFYGDFADGAFGSTQYLRHPSVPLYTPEPDMIHEVIGHGNHLADPEIAALYRTVGSAVARTTTDAGLRALSQIFWFTVEFGVVGEGRDVRAFGAGLLSSVGELGAYRSARIEPADLAAMVAADYDITAYQPWLASYSSETALIDTLAELFGAFDDDTAARLAAEGAAPATTA